jgi:hypothetical protein
MLRFAAALLGLALAGTMAQAKEYPIGKPQKVEAAGVEVAAVYLQPIEMEPPGMMRPAKESDIHFEADIKALKSNKNGYAEGDWVGYLKVTYELVKSDGQIVKGDAMPMVASDGPHYGDNVKLAGPGNYKLKVTVAPPANDAHSHFGRHVDKETGVNAWFAPFTVEYDFTFAGVGKKGSY